MKNCILSAALVAASSAQIQAAILANPTVTNSAPAFSGAYVAGNMFDGNRDSEYASAGQGANTFVDLDFGSAVTMDRFFVVTRLNTVDVVGEANLILSNNADFSSPVATVVINPSGQNGAGNVISFATTTARYARWDVITSIGGSQNLGGIEMRFLNSPTGTTLAPTTIIGGAAAFSPDYAVANAANSNVGRDGSGNEYAINGGLTGAANMYVDFDFGAATTVAAFDFFDRMATPDRTTGFDLIFSNDPSFSTVLSTQSFTTGADWGYSQNISPVNARYVRFDATASGGNSGMADMIFYAVPEASTGLLFACTGLLAMARRRR